MLSTIRRAILNLKYGPDRYDLNVEIEKLDRKLRRIQETIEEVEHRENHNETVTLWIQELECLASDAEDVLDLYNYELLREKLEEKLDASAPISRNIAGMVYNSGPSIAMVKCGSPYFSRSIIMEMFEKIRTINSRFDEISRDREALRLTNEEGKRRDATDSINLSATSHLMNTDGIFGRIGDKKTIIDFLLSGVSCDEERHDQLRVIPILGMGVLARLLLHKWFMMILLFDQRLKLWHGYMFLLSLILSGSQKILVRLLRGMLVTAFMDSARSKRCFKRS